MELLPQMVYPKIPQKLTAFSITKIRIIFEKIDQKIKLYINENIKLKSDIEQVETENNSLIHKIKEIREEINQEIIKIQCLENQNNVLEIVNSKRQEEYDSKTEIIRQEAMKFDKQIKNLEAFLKMKITVKPLNIDVIDSEVYLFDVTIDNKSASIAFNVEEDIFDLISINPQHKNFDRMREFLQTTNDIRGFLTGLTMWSKT